MDDFRVLDPDDQLWPLRIAAALTGLSPQTLRRLGKSGAIPIERPAGPTGNMFLSQRTILQMVSHAPATWWRQRPPRDQPRDQWGRFTDGNEAG